MHPKERLRVYSKIVVTSLFVGSHGNYTEDHARRAAKRKSTVSMQTILIIP